MVRASCPQRMTSWNLPRGCVVSACLDHRPKNSEKLATTAGAVLHKIRDTVSEVAA